MLLKSVNGQGLEKKLRDLLKGSEYEELAISVLEVAKIRLNKGDGYFNYDIISDSNRLKLISSGKANVIGIESYQEHENLFVEESPEGYEFNVVEKKKPVVKFYIPLKSA